MEFILAPKKVYLAQSHIPNAGRGVFSSDLIKKGEIIEISPVIQLPQSDILHLKQTLLRNYYFLWGEHAEGVAVGLGFSSLYNHSYDKANATYTKNFLKQVLVFTALVTIPKDTEILVNYNFGNPSDKTPLWITDIPQPEQ